MTLHSGWLAPTGQTRQGSRHIAVGATTPTTPLTARSGILPGTNDGKYRVGGLWMSGNGPMTATVYAGRAIVQGPAVQGAYPVALDQDTVLTFADGDPLNARIDLVVLRVYDDQYDSSKRSEAAIEIVKGTPSAVPAAPAAPPLSLPLFSVKVVAGASAGTNGILWSGTGIVTDLRVTTASVGGILPVYNNAAVPGSYPGQYQDNDNAHFLQRWDGTGWIAYPKEVGGIAANGTLPTGSYVGQFRETNGVLQRWNGTVWATYHPPVEVETASGSLNTYAGWTATWSARRTRGIATVRMSVTRTGTDITAGANGYITDQQMCALPPGWPPGIAFEAMASDTMATGCATITATGVVTLRSWTPTAIIRNGGVVNVTATYVL
ncbi:hypothetical protein AQF52_4794 [Streptomyces venezuelae]|uniref:hypothetical protein n=1 Tax=Streptomyces gardneri TaxID=66892 RepID=UPI0006BCAAA4|nr:hypothetical protein [Streptomyces gardneri]ALO10388.1 hypothetical protein AQF52_4794 [Streptomyces venezuelae]QPK47398.1 hypothetical protein H4W23_24065 [Streptomyces gardneri]WRK38826.1 hypothetical protein U0M97_24165 [Streptomyces venezuelae]CUM39149.1 FIG01124909: hypothetical protein [Streptomyces venezuelae]